MTGIPDLGIRVDIMGRVLDPLLCVFLADIQSVGIGACMHVCVWYTELTCISNGVSKTDIVVGKVQCAGAQFEGDLGEILALGAEISPYIGLREKWESP